MPENQMKLPAATYRVIALGDATFAIEVVIEGTSPTMVTSFPTEAAAEVWITAHKARVLNPPNRVRWRSRHQS